MKVQSLTRKFMLLLACAALVVTMSFLTGCSGNDGSSGAAAPTTGAISGAVTTQVGSLPLEGVTVTTNPDAGVTGTTDANGNFTLSVPGGAYTVTLAKQYYTSATASVNVANGVTTPLSAAMAESASGYPTSLTLVASGNNVGYGQAFTVTANATDPNGGTLSYVWTDATGSGNTATATSQTLDSALAGIAAPSTDPGAFVAPFVQEKRFGVLGINPDTRGAKSVSVKVSDGQGGTTTAKVTVNSSAVQPGVRQVSVGIPVFLNSGTTATTVWNDVTTPSGTLALSTAGTNNRNPWFVPSAPGAYVVSTSTGSTITLFAGNYAGAISGGTYTSKTVDKANGMWYSWAPSATQSSMTFTNWPTVTPVAACNACHSATFSEWGETVHATFFSRGVENITSNGATCTTCHTAGGSGGAGGYLETAASTTGYKYPTKGTGAWAALVAGYPGVAKVTNIQCENCHGAQTDFSTGAGTGHSSAGLAGGSTAPAAARVSYSSDICGSCHASGTGHHFFSEWNALNPDSGNGHSKIAQLDATGYTGHARSTDGSCVRCHTAQGFVAYLPQLLSGNAGTVPQSVITWTKDNVMPQTCVTCHDPHSDANANQLRVVDSLPTSMAGFGVNGVGKGAICMACHNNRNGIQCASAPTATGQCVGGALSQTGATFLHEDNDAFAATILDSMHDASQTEVLMGRDFFFMGNSLPMLSKHASVEDTCVGCHMALNPQTHLSHGAPAVNTHNFYIKDADRAALCANCHSSSVNGEALVALVEDQLEVLAEKMSANLLSRATGTIYVASKLTPTASTTINPVVATSITYFDGSFCINGTFTPGTTTCSSVYKAGLTVITSDAAGALPIAGPDDVLKKASWNWTMIERDGSMGIHNPNLITSVLNNTIAQFP